jgi:hypothetical protein
MENSVFNSHLLAATKATLDFTRTLCWNKLSDNVEFIIQPDNLDENVPYLSGFEMLHFRQRKAEVNTGFSLDEVADRLWVKGHVPVWINISVQKAKCHKTIIELLIDRRLRQDDDEIYHKQEGYPPFHVLVSIPPYRTNQQGQIISKKFNINWKHWPWKLRVIVNRLLFRIRTRNYQSFK